MSNLAQRPFFQERPAIYVDTYHAYNCGSLAGKWFYLDEYVDLDEFQAAIKAFHHTENDPEFMFQDWEHIPEALISESYIDPAVWDYIDLNDDERIAFDWLTDDLGMPADDAINRACDVQLFHGPLTEYIEDLYDQCYEIPTHLESYIDYAAIARDWLFNGDADFIVGKNTPTRNYYDLVQRDDVTFIVNAGDF